MELERDGVEKAYNSRVTDPGTCTKDSDLGTGPCCMHDRECWRAWLLLLLRKYTTQNTRVRRIFRQTRTITTFELLRRLHPNMAQLNLILVEIKNRERTGGLQSNIAEEFLSRPHLHAGYAEEEYITDYN